MRRRRSLTVAITIIVLCLISASFSTQYSAGSVMKQNTPQQDVDAKVLFEKHCDTCHGKDGQAKTFKAKFNHARNLTDAEWQAQVSDERIFNSITNGKGKMPSWGKKLSEAQINALVAYVRKLKK
jgi:cbb3-type cytochrome c oxidase subunit III